MQLEGKIQRFLFHNKTNGFGVVLFRVEKGLVTLESNTIKITGIFPDVDTNLKYQVEADTFNHPKYGLTYKLISISAIKITEEEVLIKYLSSSSFPGIGLKKAEKIVTILGVENFEKLNQNPELLQKINLTQNDRKTILAKINEEQSEQVRFTNYLARYNMVRYSDMFKRAYSLDNFLELIKKDPYELFLQSEIVSWNAVDLLAKNLQFDEDSSQAKPIAFFLNSIYTYIQNTGNTLFDIDSIQNYFWKNYFLTKHEFWKALLELVDKRKKIVSVNLDGLQLRRDYEIEKKIYQRLLNIADNKNFLSKQAFFENDFRLSKKQNLAVKTALKKPLTIISGAPGTGKTSVIKSVLKCFPIEIHKSIAIVAPIGRAVQQIVQKSEFKAFTIHRLLKWDRNTNLFNVNELHPLNHQILIIDESSMLTPFLFHALLEGLPRLKKIIFIGDADQLPPIEAGQLFIDLIQAKFISKIYLQENFRQKENGLICKNSTNILKNKSLEFDQAKVFFHEINDLDYHQLHNLFLKYKKDSSLTETQILIPSYKGAWGINEINSQLQKQLHFKTAVLFEVNNQNFYLNDKVIQTDNDYEKDVYNGEIGLICEYHSNSQEVVVQFLQKQITYTLEDFQKSINLAYAISIHKAQGSEFQNVIFVLPNLHSLFLSRQLFYTAWTRAREKIALISSESTFSKAINNVVASRKTLLSAFF